ncbi:MAG: flagellin lysine-N-methylase [Cellulosilyticaceae bacterium]
MLKKHNYYNKIGIGNIMKQDVKMNLYDQFKCSADKCSMTCCQQWRIGIDDETYDMWCNKQYKNKYLSKYAKEDDDGYFIPLNQKKQCPFLNDNKLCNIVTQYGDEILTEACKQFPRQIIFNDNHVEYSLDTGCPVVIDQIYNENGKVYFNDKNLLNKNEYYKIRQNNIMHIQNSSYTIDERLLMILYMLIEWVDNKKTDVKLDLLRQAIKDMKCNFEDMFFESNELFLDVTHNYIKQNLYTDQIKPIAAYAETISNTVDSSKLKKDYSKFLDEFERYEVLIGKFLALEIMRNNITDESNDETIIVYNQWLILTYIVIRQALFLYWHYNGCQKLNYENVRMYLSTMARITGYTQNDIEEYLRESFENIRWDWGYAAMIVGNYTKNYRKVDINEQAGY